MNALHLNSVFGVREAVRTSHFSSLSVTDTAENRWGMGIWKR